MNITKDMEKDLITLLATVVLEKDDDAPFRLSEQAEALSERKCSDPELGKWVNKCDFPFLIETLLLDDAIFSKEFPNVRLTAEERRGFANALEAHCEKCDYCHLKRSYDLEWQLRINRAFAENKQVIGEAIARTIGKNEQD